MLAGVCVSRLSLEVACPGSPLPGGGFLSRSSWAVRQAGI